MRKIQIPSETQSAILAFLFIALGSVAAPTFARQQAQCPCYNMQQIVGYCGHADTVELGGSLSEGNTLKCVHEANNEGESAAVHEFNYRPTSPGCYYRIVTRYGVAISVSTHSELTELQNSDCFNEFDAACAYLVGPCD